uniref:Uncharacterized protein n=1 Tax=Tetradesmus obliquus TaxID=3088 RepID=A0A383VU48_TETOB
MAATLQAWADAVSWLGAVLPAVELPGAAGTEEVCVGARQQLLQLQGRLQQDLQGALATLASSSSSSSSGNARGDAEPAATAEAGALPPAVAAVLPGLAQQMVALGHALCAQLPLACCCNNPRCRQLRGVARVSCSW